MVRISQAIIRRPSIPGNDYLILISWEYDMTANRVCINTLVFALLFVFAYPGIAATVKGKASYYADSLQGNKTASGEPYDSNAMTAAHRSLTFGTKVKVTYLKTGKTVEVTINDRGPHVEGRIIDLSGAAADAIGLKNDGIGEVEIVY